MSELFHIGSITSGYRPIKRGDQYNTYFPKPGHEDRIIIQDGTVDDTVELMKKVVWKYIDDTKEIAPRLNSISKKQTCQNIWDFLYHHIQYKLDERGLEQLRRPARSWVERETGIDCDCFSIFCSSILTNLNIPHKFRITKYDSPNYQHVYVVIPDGSKEIIIDPVLSRFNYEKTYSTKKDFTMNLQGIDVAVLSGVNGDWAYGTQAQAAKAGISATQWNNSKKALQKIESLYADKIQGDKKALKDAILKGKAGGLNGFVQPLGELGEPITMTAAIAAATPLIVATIKIMKDAGLFSKDEDTSTKDLEAEAKAANSGTTNNTNKRNN